MKELIAVLMLAVVTVLVGATSAWDAATHGQRYAVLSLCWIRSCPPPKADDDVSLGPSENDSYWRHDGALVYLRTDAAVRRFYRDPPPGLHGDDSDDDDADKVLFDGHTDNTGRWRGTAFLFDTWCGERYPYPIAGATQDAGWVVMLSGHAPRIDTDCHVAGYERTAGTLTFTFAKN